MRNILSKLTLAATLALTLASSAWAVTFPNGNYVGHGKYTTSEGKTGTYDVKVTINNNQMTKTMTFEGKTVTLDTVLTVDKNGFGTTKGTFTDSSGTKSELTAKVSCGDHGCGYWNSQEHFGGGFGVKGDMLYEMGSATEKNNVQVRWEEKLKKVNPLE